MFLQKKVKKIVRPNIWAFFLAFNLLQLGFFLIGESGLVLMAEHTKINQVIALAESDEKEQVPEQKLEKLQQKMYEAFLNIQTEFSTDKLFREANEAYLFRNTKIHYFAAVMLGLASCLLGVFFLLLFARNWKSSCKELRRCSPEQNVVLKTSLMSKIVVLVTLVMGTIIVIVSALALKELIYYRDEAWMTALFNYDAMTRLSGHYQSTLMLGIIYCASAIISSVFQLKGREIKI